MFDEHRLRIQTLGRAAGSVLRVHEVMQKAPILSIQRAASAAGISEPTASAALARMMELGLVAELTGRQRDRLFSYPPYVAILAEGTEPL